MGSLVFQKACLGGVKEHSSSYSGFSKDLFESIFVVLKQHNSNIFKLGISCVLIILWVVFILSKATDGREKTIGPFMK